MCNSALGLISSPIRTVTRKEIVPGVYGIVRVARPDVGLSVSLDPFNTPEELREAAHILNQLAEVLEDV